MFFRKPRKNRILVLIDLENLMLNRPEMHSIERFSIPAGFDRLIGEIAGEVGEIVNVFAFIPPHLTHNWGENLHEQGFYTIACPRVHGKEGQEQDTTDATIINLGKDMIREMKDLTHLCIGSGDKDFLLLVRWARQKGLKVIVIAASTKSLSTELSKRADKTFIFSPTES